MARPTNLTLCSFCGKSHAEVKKLIAGPGVYICDNCGILCKNVLDKELVTADRKPPPAPVQHVREAAGRRRARLPQPPPLSNGIATSIVSDRTTLKRPSPWPCTITTSGSSRNRPIAVRKNGPTLAPTRSKSKREIG